MKVNASLIKRLREERGWSQEHLAAVSGLSARTIQRLEGEGKASHESRLALATALEVEASALNAPQADHPFADAERMDTTIALWQAWLGRSTSVEAKALRLFCVMLAAWFIYQAGHAAGEAWYYFTH